MSVKLSVVTRGAVFSLGALLAWCSCASGVIAAEATAPLSNASPVLAELAKQATDPDRPESERLQLIQLLGNWKTTQVRAPLLVTLKDPLPSIRAASARALGLPGDHEAAAALRERLEAPGETSAVRAAAVESLGRIGDPSTRSAIVAATRDPDNAVRSAALRGLTFGALAQPDDRAMFLRQSAEDRGVDLLERSEAVMALGETGDTAAADLLMRLLEHEPAIPMPLPKESPSQQDVVMIRYRQARDIRAWAAKSLGLLNARAALPLLLRSAESPNDFFLRATSVQALVAWKAPEAVPVLIRRLTDPLPDIRMLALKGLAKQPAPNVVDAVLSRLTDENSRVRVQVIETLVELGDPRVRRELEVFRASNVDPEVDQALDKALARLPR